MTSLPPHRLLIDGAGAQLADSAASPNWFAALELYCAPIPRERHGKAGVLRSRHATRKQQRRPS